jgi:TonB family protein
MRQSTLALLCGLALFVILAYSWCGRNPLPQGNVLSTAPTPTPAGSPAPSTSAIPNPTASASAVASASASAAASPTPTPVAFPPEFEKVVHKADPAVVELTIFDAKGQLLRSGNAFYVSRDGLLATSLDLVSDGAYGVAKSSDGKIRNVLGVIDFSKTTGLAILRAETKVGVPFLPLQKNSESIAVNAWGAVVSSSLEHKEQPVAGGLIKSLGADPKKDAFQIGGTIPSDAAGAPVIDANGDVVGVVTAGGKNDIQPSGQLEPLLAVIKTGTAAKWAAAPVETPSPTPTPRVARRVLYNPAPKYPFEARSIRVGPNRGNGKYRVTFGTNGLVKNVQTVESTGQPILDSAAIEGLRQWRAEPGASDWTVLVPITFAP